MHIADSGIYECQVSGLLINKTIHFVGIFQQNHSQSIEIFLLLLEFFHQSCVLSFHKKGECWAEDIAHADAQSAST